MALALGSRLGPYDITALLGAGGMGEVYRATDTNLGRHVAIKVLPAAVAQDAERVARFEREAKTLAALNHPNIAQIYGLERTDGVTGLVMELVEGDDLAQRIARGPIPLDEALPIAKQIAEALEAAHELGIIHRDLKPANVKVRPEGTVKVLDFGLAKALEPAGSSPNVSQSPTITSPAMTQRGVILGTAAYMSPEQARGKTVDKRADIWAFGCVLYEMLTGQRAFLGEDVTETLAAVVKLDPNWDLLAAGVPGRVQQALRVCLRKDPRQRAMDIHDVRLALEGAFETAVPQTAAAADFARRWQRSARLAWLLAGAFATGCLALSVAYVRRAPPVREVVRFNIMTPLSDEPGSIALSPDGRQLAFVAVSGGKSQLWVQRLDQTEGLALEGTEGAIRPFWAPDSRAIGFFADGRLKRVDIGGGTPQTIADGVGGTNAQGTWSQDDVIVFSQGTVGGLLRVAAAGGSVAPVTRTTPRLATHLYPQFLPDGRRFLFYVAGATDVRGIYLSSLDDSESVQLVVRSDGPAVYAAPGFLLVDRQNTVVAWSFDPSLGQVSGEPLTIVPRGDEVVGTFSASSTGVLAYRMGAAGQRRQLLWVDRAGNTLGSVGPVDAGFLGSPELAPDGARVVVTRNLERNQDIWLVDSRGLPTRFTSNPAIDLAPLWSPDGSRVVFKSNRLGVDDLYEKSVTDPGDEQPLLVSGAGKSPLDWSPDGLWLLYTVFGNSQVDIWVLPLTGEKKPFPLMETPFGEAGAQFSPDGQWVAYTSNESGVSEIYVQRFPAAARKVRISSGGGTQPRWRRDGRELFYLASDDRLMAVSMDVAPDGQALESGTPVALFVTRLATGGGTGAGVGAAIVGPKQQYAIAADGRFLMNVVVSEADSPPVTVVLNWLEELKRLAPTK